MPLGPPILGAEIGYDERTSADTATTSTTPVDVAGVPTVIVPAGPRPFVIRFGFHLANGVTATEQPCLVLTDTSNVEAARVYSTVTANNGSAPSVHGYHRFPVPTVSKSYKLRKLSAFGTSITLQAATTYPIYLHAVWV